MQEKSHQKENGIDQLFDAIVNKHHNIYHFQRRMDESVQEGEGELRRRNLEGNATRGELGNVDADTTEQQQVEVKEKVTWHWLAWSRAYWKWSPPGRSGLMQWMLKMAKVPFQE